MLCEAMDTLPTLARATLKGQLLNEVGKVTSACVILDSPAHLTVEDLALLILPPPAAGGRWNHHPGFRE